MQNTISNLINLTEIQLAVLEVFEREDALNRIFYFTGGTLLKARGIVPRISNDLDFFTFPHIGSLSFLTHFRAFRSLIEKTFGSEHIVITDRGFIHQPSGVVIDVVADAMPNIDEFVMFDNLSTVGLKDIAANKASALCSRDEIKDYIDIAFLTKHQGLSLINLEEYAEKKFGLGTVTEEKLVTEILSKQSLFTLPLEIFLQEPEKNSAIVQQQIAHLLETSTL